jgi:hypothetical protein
MPSRRKDCAIVVAALDYAVLRSVGVLVLASERVGREDAMLLASGVAGAMGLLLGLLFRVPALLAASLMTATVCLSVAAFTELTLMTVIVITIALLGVLQVAYFMGLTVTCAVSRARPSAHRLVREVGADWRLRE